ncbi:efflux RND transporter periplasmic adaptor subunit [Gallaecimonas kandeliae]|uniref:efflux RND transporter periplasmic adaptor subunit n=1 Tax=Gallaecimonas kandeliae TaxID=3029055 RepID=UPI002647362F|nr:efflux RND transporter periplasmic adaptor subunit [Gallaecimonas kandeliae]WKE67065.1 efflux RND transporter periplasmic adaptor subunit [Gallaecimonas kandeliae]
MNRTVIAVALATLLAACSNGEAKVDEKKKEEAVLVPVSVAAVKVAPMAAHFESHGVLTAEHEAKVVARVSGLVESLDIEEGDDVKAGQVLASVEPDRYQLERDRINAQTQSVAQELERTQNLYGKKLVSADTLDKLKLQLAALKAQLGMAELDLKYATVKAPISGTISRRYIKTGNLVNPDQPLFDIVQHQDLRLDVPVPEQYLAALKQAQGANCSFAALPGKTFKARITRLSPVVDPTTGTARLTLNLPNGDGQLMPGMFANVQISYDLHPSAHLIPRQALINQSGGYKVFVIQDGIAKLKPVTLGNGDRDWVEVKGLDAGEQVVTLGQHHLKDEAKVEVIAG